MITEPGKNIPVIGEYDVVVVGGGIAGVSAAVAAGRNGAKVCIVEKEQAPGGLATLGLIVYYLPLCDGMGNQVIGGLGEELLKLSIKYGPGKIPECWRNNGSKEERKKNRYCVDFNPASFILSLEELLLKEKIKLFYDTRFCDVIVQDNRITALLIENKSGRNALLCRVAIDASGDADLCQRAGEKTVSLNTNRRSAWCFFKNGSKIELDILGDPFYKKLSGKIKTFSGDNWEDVTEINIQSRKLILKRLKSLRKGKDYSKKYPILIPTLPQFRMTRRLQGVFQLDEKDDKRWFRDTVGIIGDWRKSGPVFAIPYRCLTAKNISNLLTAGRCISVTNSAWDITRAIPACAVTGEAAGTAAALCVRTNNNLNVCQLDLITLRDKLKKQGVILEYNTV